ncbi:MAG: hypothetical protein U0X20_24160 [Caldilineaceae bacterium]
MPGLDFAHAGEVEGFNARVARHVTQGTLFGDAGRQLTQRQAVAAKDDLVRQRAGGHGLDAAALDVQLVHAVQLFRRPACHDLSKPRFDTAAGHDQDAGLIYQLIQCGQFLVRRPGQVDPRLACCRSGAQAKRDDSGGERGDHGVVGTDQGHGCFVVGQVEHGSVQLIAGVQAVEPCLRLFERACIRIGERDALDIHIQQGVVGGGRPHQAAADDKNLHESTAFRGMKGLGLEQARGL